MAVVVPQGMSNEARSRRVQSTERPHLTDPYNAPISKYNPGRHISDERVHMSSHCNVEKQECFSQVFILLITRPQDLESQSGLVGVAISTTLAGRNQVFSSFCYWRYGKVYGLCREDNVTIRGVTIV